jgi:hypothetical protein
LATRNATEIINLIYSKLELLKCSRIYTDPHPDQSLMVMPVLYSTQMAISGKLLPAFRAYWHKIFTNDPINRLSSKDP